MVRLHLCSGQKIQQCGQICLVPINNLFVRTNQICLYKCYKLCYNGKNNNLLHKKLLKILFLVSIKINNFKLTRTILTNKA